jgi:hypothetical protein
MTVTAVFVGGRPVWRRGRVFQLTVVVSTTGIDYYINFFITMQFYSVSYVK